MNPPRMFTLPTRLLSHAAAAAAGLCLVFAAHAQTRPADAPTTATTESVLKQTLPPINLQPGAPSDGTARVSEPQRYVDLQHRIAKLRAENRACPDDYHLAKAQAWLNFARDQYHESAWQKNIQETTLNESARIVTALETHGDPGFETPLVSESLRVRPDLWAIAERIRKDRSGLLCCAPRETAFCEVQLVWSGHALANLGGWRRANPHVLMAEDLCHEAERKVCVAPAPAAAKPAPPVIAPTYEKITLAANALFRHDKSARDEMLPAGRASLDELAARLKGLSGLERVLISGHSDITNSTGDPAYNDRLSLARANTVRSYLAEQGVFDRGLDASRVEIASWGHRRPVKTDCAVPHGAKLTAAGLVRNTASRSAMAVLEACLQPNRRVEIELFGTISPGPAKQP